MGILDVILIGMALSIDACALTIANCSTYKNTLNRKKEWAMPITFALFQGIMPLLGYFVGLLFADKIKNISGYITFAIFFLLAIKIVIDNIKEIKKEKSGAKEEVKRNFGVILLLIQGIATSIDALLIGVTLSLKLNFLIYYAVLIIAAVTFILVTIALFLGKSIGKIFGKYAVWVGAIILFALAIKSLIEAIIG